jgi:nucleoside-diphosphate-sugar epimerase
LSLCFVEDLVQGIILAAESPAPSGSIYYLSEETIYSWKDLADEVGRAVGRKISPLRVPSPLLFLAATLSEGLAFFTRKPPLLNHGKALEMIQPHWICNPSKAMEELGFRAKVPLSMGAQRTARWYREAGWLDDHPGRGGCGGHL